MEDKSTDVREILQRNKQPPPPQQQQPPAQQFDKQPQEVQQVKPIPPLQGPGQGFSKPLLPQQEFFGLVQESDIKIGIAVFGLTLIFTSSIFYNLINKYIPSTLDAGKVTSIGNLISAFIIAILTVLIKMYLNSI